MFLTAKLNLITGMVIVATAVLACVSEGYSQVVSGLAT